MIKNDTAKNDTSKRSTLEWIDKMSLQCGDVILKLMPGMKAVPSTDHTITLLKDPAFLRTYIDCLKDIDVNNMIEVGVKHGGSAIFFWHLLGLDKLSCIEIGDSAPYLTRYIDTHNLHDCIHTHFGVDQGDKKRLLEIVSEDFLSESLDLVIDDASHIYTPSIATFEALFPLIRPGGLYILEDWRASLLTIEQHQGSGTEPRLDRLVHEILEFSTVNPHIIPTINCNKNFVVVERGEGFLPARDFELAKITEYFVPTAV